MGDARPLAGKRVVVTRAPEQAQELVRLLEESGAEVLLAPAVRFEAPVGWEPLDAALRELASFDWLIFTSQNAVRFVSVRQKENGGRSALRGGGLKVAAVGEPTAAAAKAAGFSVDFVASRFQGKALAEELGERLKGARVLLPRSDRGRPDLPAALRAAGATVTEVIAYRTMDADLGKSAALEEIRLGRVDVIAFASPSAFQALADAMESEELSRIRESTAIAAIGPVTADAIREAGLTVHVVAEESSATGLAMALTHFFEEQQVRAGVAAR